MNHNQSSDDLGAALHGLADGVGSVPPAVPDTEFAANVRLRTKAVRRRRRNQRIGVATACLALVAVGGIVVAQNLPGREAPPLPIATSPTADAVFPECGSVPDLPDGDRPLTLVSSAHTDDDGVPLDHSAPEAKPWATDLDVGSGIPLEVRNNSSETLTVGSTGYASLVIVKDGVVVTEPGGMPEPFTSPTLQPGEMTPVNPTVPTPCAGSDLPDGDYDAYALLDAEVSSGSANTGSDGSGSDGAADSVVVYGGPWKIRLGETTVSPEALSLQCGDEVSEIPRFTDPIRIDLPIPPTDLEDLAGGRPARIAFRNSSDQSRHLSADRVETFLTSDGKVIASASTEQDLDLEFGPDSSAGQGALARVPGVRCDGGDPVQSGEYQFFVIVNFTDVDSGELVEAILGHEDITITASDPDGTTSSPTALPPPDPTVEFPACGAAVPKEDDSVFALITTEPIEALSTGKRSFSTPIEITNTTQDRLIGNSASSVLGYIIQDGRVVGGAEARDGDARLFDLGPGESYTMNLAIEPKICGENGTVVPLPAGEYQIWVQEDFTLKERQLPDGTSESTSEIITATIALTHGTIPITG